MHIYVFTHNVFNIEIYRDGAHTFICMGKLSTEEMWFPEGRIFLFASRTCLSVYALESLSRWGIFHPATPSEMTKENQRC